MEWLWDKWVEGVLCGEVGVCVHVQGDGPVCQETEGEVVFDREGCGGEHEVCGGRRSEG